MCLDVNGERYNCCYLFTIRLLPTRLQYPRGGYTIVVYNKGQTLI